MSPFFLFPRLCLLALLTTAPLTHVHVTASPDGRTCTDRHDSDSDTGGDMSGGGDMGGGSESPGDGADF